jgi:type IV fimbrial biogenesis protein FimT
MLNQNHYADKSLSQRGVTLVELMVGLAILAGLLAMAIPFAGHMITNAKIRTAAESILSGLQLARSSAVNQNAQVQFVLSSTLTDSSWYVGCVSPSTTAPVCPATIQARSGVEGTTQVQVASNITPVAFSGFGALTTTTATALTAVPANAVNICVGIIGMSSSSASAYSSCSSTSERRLWVSVTPSGSIRMCDPALSQPDPQAC